MKKAILIGSMLVFIMLLLMPSIPAIQHNIVKNKIEDKIVSEFPEDLDFKDIKELIESRKLDRIKHPLLYVIITVWLWFRIIRGIILVDISSDPFLWTIQVYHPIMFIRGIWLTITGWHMIDFLNMYSDILGWNWNIKYP